jgi:rfaE bifunctional protein nucleotidyltransferase chain/domain
MPSSFASQTVEPGSADGSRVRARKILSRIELVSLAADARAQLKRIVFTNGCFDLLHVGHIRLLQEARRKGDMLIVALNSDASVRALKGVTRPIIPEADRLEIVAALECVDFVLVFDEHTPLELIAILKPDVHVKGGDYNPNDYHQMPEAQAVRAYGGVVVIVPLVHGRATSSLIRSIEQGEGKPLAQS